MDQEEMKPEIAEDAIEQQPPAEVESAAPPKLKYGQWEATVRNALKFRDNVDDTILSKYFIDGNNTERLKSVAVRQARMTDLFAGEMVNLMNKVNSLNADVIMLRQQIRQDIPEMTAEIDDIKRTADGTENNLIRCMGVFHSLCGDLVSALAEERPLIGRKLCDRVARYLRGLANSIAEYRFVAKPELERGDDEKPTKTNGAATTESTPDRDGAKISGDPNPVRHPDASGDQAGDSQTEVGESVFPETKVDQEYPGDERNKPE